MQPAVDPARALARRLRELREQEWSDVAITQRQLAEVLGVSVPLISSWESQKAIPPPGRLVAYATFFASRRTVEQFLFRMLTESEMTSDERARKDELSQELLNARAAAIERGGSPPVPSEAAVTPLGGPWSFQDAQPVTMVCAELPEHQRERLPEPDDREGAYAALYAYADLDALFELHGHIRAANPASLVTVRTSSELKQDDYTTHLVVLGGVDWNRATRSLLPYMPVTQASSEPAGAYFEVKSQGERQDLRAELTPEDRLASDVGHFFRAPNPFNRKRTVTVCNGLFGRGVLGAVRALTDERFRDRNADYLAERFAGSDTYSIVMRVPIIGGAVLTPDWTRPDVRLHEWPEASA